MQPSIFFQDTNWQYSCLTLMMSLQALLWNSFLNGSLLKSYISKQTMGLNTKDHLKPFVGNIRLNITTFTKTHPTRMLSLREALGPIKTSSTTGLRKYLLTLGNSTVGFGNS